MSDWVVEIDKQNDNKNKDNATGIDVFEYRRSHWIKPVNSKIREKNLSNRRKNEKLNRLNEILNNDNNKEIILSIYQHLSDGKVLNVNLPLESLIIILILQWKFDGTWPSAQITYNQAKLE